jgi:GDPmannose 4,6-dehydratase
MLELERPDDFVVATGEGHTVRDLVSGAFGLVGLDWQKYVQVDESLVRRSEQVPSIGNSAKLERAVGAAPRVRFNEVLRILLAHDLRSLGCAVPFDTPDPALPVPPPRRS